MEERKMKKILFAGLITAAFLFSGCASSVRVFHDMDRSADFTQYATYNFLEWTEGNLKTINEIERERIRTAFGRELESHGFVYKKTGADVSVKITVYHREKNQMYPSYPYYYSPFYSPFYSYYYNPYYSMYPRIYNYMERAIAIDIYDNNAKKHIWHSAAVGELDYNPQKREERLPLIAEKMLKDLPKEKVEGI